MRSREGGCPLGDRRQPLTPTCRILRQRINHTKTNCKISLLGLSFDYEAWNNDSMSKRDDNFKGQKGKTPINTKTNINVEFETSPKEIGCYSTIKV